MRPCDIQVGISYRNKGKGRTTRTVVAIGNDIPAPWYSGNERPDELVVKYEQDGTERTLYLRSFAAWAGSVCDS